MNFHDIKKTNSESRSLHFLEAMQMTVRSKPLAHSILFPIIQLHSKIIGLGVWNDKDVNKVSVINSINKYSNFFFFL